MDDQDDPYSLLGVSRDASVSQIRSAYRKLALLHHPDRVASEDKATANLLFSKISNAYEILSDESKRAEYDNQQQQGQPFRHSTPHYNDDFSHYHPQQSSSSHFDNHFHHHFHFHDPFEVFRHVFREEFGGGGPSTTTSSSFRAPPAADLHHSMMSSFMNDPFMNDPFFADPFGRRGGMPSRGGMGGVSPFGGGGGAPGNIFSQLDQMMGSMHGSIHDDIHNQFHSNGHGNGVPPSSNYSFVSSSSTSTSYGRGGESVTTQTTRRIVNGKEEMVTERIVRKADGTVEREILHNNDNSPRLEQQQQQQPPQASLENGPADSHTSNAYVPWRRRSSKSKQK